MGDWSFEGLEECIIRFSNGFFVDREIKLEVKDLLYDIVSFSCVEYSRNVDFRNKINSHMLNRQNEING